MAELLKEYGFRIPILIRSNGEIIDGDLRLKAAIVLGYTEVPVIVCDDWTEAQVKAFRLAVNRSATWADFDLEVVAVEMRELKALNFDLSLTGFTSFEINRMIFDKAEEETGEAGPGGGSVTQKGDVWDCCGHRIMCGDSTSAEHVNLLLGSVKPGLMVIDPPYGTGYDPMWREEADLGHQRQTGTVPNDDRADWREAYRLFPGDVAYVWHAGIHAGEVAAGLVATGFVIRAQIIWAKQHFAMSRGDYHWQHEPCWYAVRQGKSSNWSGDRRQSTLWEVANLNPFGGDRETEATGHGTQKPVELMQRPILNHTQPGDAVYDAFLGSGSTLIAAEKTGRLCYGMDIYPPYVDQAVKRWQKLTGKQATLVGNGRTFEDIANNGRSATLEASNA
jgi:DNA modification methylase